MPTGKMAAPRREQGINSLTGFSRGGQAIDYRPFVAPNDAEHW
jgi:hypothetical protein